MLIGVLVSLLAASVIATEKDASLRRLTDLKAVEKFIDSAEVVIIGFLEIFREKTVVLQDGLEAAARRVDSVPAAICTEKDVRAEYGLGSDTITLFRKADNHQENLVVAEADKLEADGLVNFITVNEVRYITEYNQVTAVGLFNSEVKTHLLLFANRGSNDFSELKQRLGALAPEFTGKFLFVLINGALQSNSRSLGYFGLKSQDLPRVGIYDGDSDMKWLLPEGDVSTERVREFCQAFVRGDLKEVKQAGAEAKTEL
ncbi:endoplasmic reticulum resident protein 27 [Lampetra planeri]